MNLFLIVCLYRPGLTKEKIPNKNTYEIADYVLYFVRYYKLFFIIFLSLVSDISCRESETWHSSPTEALRGKLKIQIEQNIYNVLLFTHSSVINTGENHLDQTFFVLLAFRASIPFCNLTIKHDRCLLLAHGPT